MTSFGSTVAKEPGELLTPEQLDAVSGGAVTITGTVKVVFNNDEATREEGSDKSKKDVDN